jgi:hypothetical protein
VLGLGAYGIGVLGDQLLSSKVRTGLVHARHRQGVLLAGSKDIAEANGGLFYTGVRPYAERLEPYVEQLDFVFMAARKGTVGDFRKQCHFLLKWTNAL